MWEVQTPSQPNYRCHWSKTRWVNEETETGKGVETCRAAVNNALTSFSPSPTNFEVNVEAEMLKKADSDSLATALASRVFPQPGGPNRSRPLVGVLRPVKSSGLRAGSMTASWSACLALSCPATREKLQLAASSMISSITTFKNLLLSAAFLLLAELLEAEEERVL